MAGVPPKFTPPNIWNIGDYHENIDNGNVTISNSNTTTDNEKYIHLPSDNYSVYKGSSGSNVSISNIKINNKLLVVFRRHKLSIKSSLLEDIDFVHTN